MRQQPPVDEVDAFIETLNGHWFSLCVFVALLALAMGGGR